MHAQMLSVFSDHVCRVCTFGCLGAVLVFVCACVVVSMVVGVPWGSEWMSTPSTTQEMRSQRSSEASAALCEVSGAAMEQAAREDLGRI